MISNMIVLILYSEWITVCGKAMKEKLTQAPKTQSVYQTQTQDILKTYVNMKITQCMPDVLHAVICTITLYNNL